MFLFWIGFIISLILGFFFLKGVLEFHGKITLLHLLAIIIFAAMIGSFFEGVYIVIVEHKIGEVLQTIGLVCGVALILYLADKVPIWRAKE